jgi:hypothetical protein
MVNRHGRGNLQRKSIIDKNGLGATVMELYGKGTSFREISDILWTKHSVKVSPMGVNRFIDRGRGDIQPNAVYDNLTSIQERVSSNTTHIYEDYNRMFEEIKTIIDTSRMQSTDKLAVKRILEAKQKIILQEFNLQRGELGMIFQAVRINEEAINTVLVEFSKMLCPGCRKKVSDCVKAHERKC